MKEGDLLIIRLQQEHLRRLVEHQEKMLRYMFWLIMAGLDGVKEELR